jgi:glycosyltransferase involved in cell wall biosynthesis
MNESLEEIGYENSVFVPTYNRNLSVIIPKENVCVCECFRKWDRLLFDYKQKKIRNALEKQFVVQDFDLIHAYTLFSDGNCARRLFKKYGIPYVVAVRNTDVNNFFRLMPHLRMRGIRILLDAKEVFFLSESYRKHVLEKYIPQKYRKIIHSKSHVIPNGIDDFWLDHAPEKENRIGDVVKLIYAGRIDRNKNILAIQEAAKILREKGYRIELTVVGKATDRKLLAAIQADPYTEYLPAQPKENLIDLYRDHNLFVMPSFTESFGLVYPEAMSQGLPVIYSLGEGFDKQFPEGTVGYHVSAGDVASVAEGIEKVLSHFDRIAMNTVQLAHAFRWKRIIAEYDAVYKALEKKLQNKNKR